MSKELNLLLIENEVLDELDFNLLRLKVNNESQKSVGVEGRYFTTITVPFKEEVST